ncbi:MAG: hypothetical protein H6581_06200 [Bacteroidia bacterium]|nr:hypothetical protein [Bacteroidia bacterium]
MSTPYKLMGFLLIALMQFSCKPESSVDDLPLTEIYPQLTGDTLKFSMNRTRDKAIGFADSFISREKASELGDPYDIFRPLGYHKLNKRFVGYFREDYQGYSGTSVSMKLYDLETKSFVNNIQTEIASSGFLTEETDSEETGIVATFYESALIFRRNDSLLLRQLRGIFTENINDLALIATLFQLSVWQDSTFEPVSEIDTLRFFPNYSKEALELKN